MVSLSLFTEHTGVSSLSLIEIEFVWREIVCAMFVLEILVSLVFV